MENEDHTGSGSVPGVRVRDLDLQGRKAALFFRAFAESAFGDIGPEGLAVVFEAFAEELHNQAQILRGWGIR